MQAVICYRDVQARRCCTTSTAAMIAFRVTGTAACDAIGLAFIWRQEKAVVPRLTAPGINSRHIALNSTCRPRLLAAIINRILVMHT